MGNFQAQQMAHAVAQGQITLANAVFWHLTANHYPPIPEYSEVLTDVLTAVQDHRIDLDQNVSLGTDFVLYPTRAWETPQGWVVQVADLIEATNAWAFLAEVE